MLNGYTSNSADFIANPSAGSHLPSLVAAVSPEPSGYVAELVIGVAT